MGPSGPYDVRPNNGQPEAPPRSRALHGEGGSDPTGVRTPGGRPRSLGQMACEQVSTGGLSRIAIPARHSAIPVSTRETEDRYSRCGAGVAAAHLLLPSTIYPPGCGALSGVIDTIIRCAP